MRDLPENYEQIVREGVEALGWLELVIERRIERSGETAARLLALRDATGLAGRLSSAEAFEGREDWIRSIPSVKDVGMLEDWEKKAPQIVHSREDPEPAASSQHPARIRTLRNILEVTWSNPGLQRMRGQPYLPITRAPQHLAPWPEVEGR